MIKAARIAAVAVSLACAMLIARSVDEQLGEISEWEARAWYDEVSALPVLKSTIAHLYLTPVGPCRRVELTGAWNVRDTLHIERPVVFHDGSRRDLPEELVFLEDAHTGHRMAIIKPAGESAESWIELMPMPGDVRTANDVGRWTPLAHWADVWLPGWADANDPLRLMWLGMTAELLRTRDVQGDPNQPPYLLRPEIRAGAPGGPERPSALTPVSIALLILATVGVLIAIRGERLVRPGT